MVAQTKYDAIGTDAVRVFSEAGYQLATYEGNVYTYRDGAWSLFAIADNADIDRILLDLSNEHSFPFAEKYRPLLKTIKVKLPSIPQGEMNAQPMIAARNGAVNVFDLSVTDHDPDLYISRRVDVDFDPYAQCPEWEKMLRRIVEDKSAETQDEYIEFLQRWFGLGLIGFGYRQTNNRQLRKLAILYGEAGTGKTSIAEVFKALFSSRDVCADSVDQISTRFGTASLAQSLAWVADDAVGTKTKADAKLLKKIITGEEMSAEKKYQDPLKFRFQGPCMITSNTKPRIEDETDALYGRSVVLTFDRVFTASDQRKTLGKHGNVVDFLRAHDEFPGILNWALRGLSIALEDGRFNAVADAAEASATWRAENDSAYAFAREFCEYDPNVYNFVSPVAAAISAFAEIEHHRRLAPRSAGLQFSRSVGSVVPGVRVGERVQFEKQQQRVYSGLVLNEAGKSWVETAREKGLLGKMARWPLNQKGL